MLTATKTLQGPAELKCERIHDEPQMQWRGIMLDSARHMQSVEFIQQLIEWMSLVKLNVLHWHLTDDQGWRLEIKQYPRLTEIGGWRQLVSTSAAMSGSEAASHHYGGYYSQDAVRKLVAFAEQRNVMIVPEIEMPGHASAALAAYPEFGSSDARLAAPVSEYGIFPNLYNVNDSTFTFIENILTEVMQLFPSPYIHIGGDEAIKDQWKASPKIQDQMKRFGIGSESELQSYFVKRVDTFLTTHHRRTVGWDEILEGDLTQNAMVMSWHGVKGGIEAAKQGYDAVLTPAHPLYFNYRQSDAADEAPGRFALNTLADVYAFDPTPTTLTNEQRKHILGIQANLWTEYVITEDRDAWMLFPRSAALAEVAWTPPERRNWDDFLKRMVTEMRRYRALGIDFDPASFRVRSAETLEENGARVTVLLSNQTNFGTLRYTTDGSAVTASSAQYERALDLPLPTHLRAAAFLEGVIPGSELSRQLNAGSVRTRYSQDLKLCSNEPVIAIEPDPPQQDRPVTLVNYINPCWIYRAADLDSVTGISVGVLSMPYVFHDRDGASPILGEPHTSNGEVEVHLDTCGGKLVATLPLGAAVGHAGVTRLRSELENVSGVHDLCLKIVRPKVNPLWSLDWVQVIQITSVTQLTGDGTSKRNLVTDGKQLYFNERIGDKEILSSMAVGGGPILRMTLPLPNPQPEDISTDGKFLLVISDEGHEDEHPLWIVPTAGDQPYQIAGVKCHTAAWAPAGDRIAFAFGEAIYIASPQGGHIRLLSHLDGIPQSLQWSLNGKHLLYFLRSLPVGDVSLWQIDLGGSLNAERVTPLRTAGDRYCKEGLLTRDANGYFSVVKDSTGDRLLQLRSQPWWRAGSLETYSLSTHLDKIDGLAADAGVRKLFVINGANQQGELVRYDLSTHSFTMLLPEAFATYVDFTKNREFAAYVKPQNASLWVSRADGSEARQLSPAGIDVELPRWSPDGKWIAFMGQLPHRPVRIFVLPASGGVFREASKGDDSQGAPTWSPDGRFLVYGNVFCQQGSTCAIHRIDLASGQVTTLPGSQGLSTARWSPDGRHIAALNSLRRELSVFDFGSRRWRKLADGINGNDVSWSSDSKYVYTKSSMQGPTEILRVAVGGGAVETVLNLDSFSKSVGQLDTWFSLTPDNALLLNRWLNTSEIYALNYKEE